jgi:hypothetical protein
VLFGIKADHITDVMIAGRFVMRNKKVVGVEEESVYHQSCDVAKRLWKRMLE